MFVITSGSKKWVLSTESGSITQSKTNEYITVTNSGGTSGQFALVSKIAVPSEAGTQYWSSVQLTGSGTIRGAQWASVDTDWSDWATTSQSSQVLPTNLSPTGRKVILKPTLSTTTTRYPVLIFDLPAGTSTVISRWMVEPNTYGNFFNGDSVFGGFVYQNNKADYGWNGSQYASYSTYSTNRTKIQETILDLLPKLLPVTMLIDVATTLNTTAFDWIPGKT